MLHYANITRLREPTQSHTKLFCNFLVKKKVTNGLQMGYKSYKAKLQKLNAVRFTGISFDVIHVYNILHWLVTLQSDKSSTPTTVLVSYLYDATSCIFSIGEKKSPALAGLVN